MIEYGHRLEVRMMEVTITAKVKIHLTKEQKELVLKTFRAYQKGCNYISEAIYKEGEILSLKKIHEAHYPDLRILFSLRSQMAQSAMKTAIGKYKSAKSNGHSFNQIRFKKKEIDLVWNRDYSLVDNLFSVNTLQGRMKVPFETKGMEHFFDGSWEFGTAKLVTKKGKFYLHIPMKKDFPEIERDAIDNVVGVDMGINFLAVAYTEGKETRFFQGRNIKDKRAQYKRVRKSLQQKRTTASRRRLKKIGDRETRFSNHMNHVIAKALVRQAGKNGLIVIEDLKGIRSATEKVCKGNRWYTVSWPFHKLREMIEYKANMNQCQVIAVDPRYTSLKCPKCGHTEKKNRDKKKHRFCCKKCSYRSNDDRVAAMNLYNKGIEYLTGTA